MEAPRIGAPLQNDGTPTAPQADEPLRNDETARHEPPPSPSSPPGTATTAPTAPTSAESELARLEHVIESPQIETPHDEDDAATERGGARITPLLGDRRVGFEIAENHGEQTKPPEPLSDEPSQPSEESNEHEANTTIRRSARIAARRNAYFLLPAHSSNDEPTPGPLGDEIKAARDRLEQAAIDVRRPGGSRSTFLDLRAYLAGGRTDLREWITDGGKILIVDLCSGGHSVASALEQAGVAHLFEVITVDSDANTNPSVVMTVQELVKRMRQGVGVPSTLLERRIDLVWCSPPCTPYSAANSRRTNAEKKRQMILGDQVVKACFDFIELVGPRVWILENPDSGDDRLARRKIMKPYEDQRHTVTYCNYGRLDRKATVIYSNMRGLTLLDCRRPGEECIAKILLGRHVRTAQAGSYRTADGDVIAGTPKLKSQLVPEELIQVLIRHALTHFESSNINKLTALAVNAMSEPSELGRRVRDLSEVPKHEIAAAKAAELRGLWDRDVFEIIPNSDIPSSAPRLTFVWVIKVRADDTVKARLCVGGHRQERGISFWETSSPTPRSTNVKLALGIAAQRRWEITTSDVSQAYVAAKLGVAMYMRPPPELIDLGIMTPGAPKSLLLRRSLYGAKQSGRNWHEESSSTLTTLGYEQSAKDPCLYYRCVNNIILSIVLAYVDDFLTLGPPSEQNFFISGMRSKYDIQQNVGLIHVWNGIEIRRSPDGKKVFVSQIAKIRQMARTFKKQLDDLGPRGKAEDLPEFSSEDNFSPLDGIDPATASPTELETMRLYQSMVGSALYVSTFTRFDVAYAMSKASRLMHRASAKHVKGISRVIRHLTETESVALTFDGDVCGPNGDPRIFGFVDSNYGNEPAHFLDPDSLGRRSTSAMVIMAFGGPIAWKSKLQSAVSTSSGEAEFRAMHLAVKELMACIHLCRELGFSSYDVPSVPLFCDASVGISHAKRDGLQWLEATKQLEIELSYVYSRVRAGDIVPIKIDGEQNPADLLTKSNISVDKRLEFRRRISGQGRSPFRPWIRSILRSGFDGTSAASTGHVSLEELCVKVGA